MSELPCRYRQRLLFVSHALGQQVQQPAGHICLGCKRRLHEAIFVAELFDERVFQLDLSFQSRRLVFVVR